MKDSKKNKKKTTLKVKDLEPETDPRGGFLGGVFVGGVRVATGDVNNDNVVGPQIHGNVVAPKSTKPTS